MDLIKNLFLNWFRKVNTRYFRGEGTRELLDFYMIVLCVCCVRHDELLLAVPTSTDMGGWHRMEKLNTKKIPIT